MAEEELDALVVRAPDNVLYLTNFWGMKGYDAVVFPREGEPVLICLEASAEDAARTAWTDGRPLHPRLRRRRPAAADRAHARARAARRRAATAASASSSSLGTQASRPHGRRADDLHRRRGSTRFAATRPTRRRCSRAARAIKTAQELERMRLANEIAAAAMEHVARAPAARDEGVARRPRSGRASSTARAPAGTGKVELALAFSLVWSGPGIKTFTATGDLPGAGGRADAVRDLGLRRRLLVRPHEEPLPGRAARRVRASSSSSCSRSTTRAVDHCRPGASLAELDRLVRDGHRRGRLPGPAVAPDLPRRSAPARTSRRTRTRPAAARSRRAWCSRSSPASTGRAAAACASRTTS